MDTKYVSASLPTKYGIFRMIVWPEVKGQEPIALLTPTLNVKEPVLVRIHSECITGDTFGSYRCDCGQQKAKALEMIAKSGNGIFIYLRQEGRGIGLLEKMKAYQLQEQGYDTHEANIMLGYNPDHREYSVADQMLKEFKVERIKLITNNLSKIYQLRDFGIDIVERVPIVIRSNKYNKNYLTIKKKKLKHLFNKNQSEYYFGISDIKKVEDVKAIARFVKDRIKDPFLKINLGICVDNTVLTDTAKQKSLEELFQEVETHSPFIVPVLHFSFRKSKHYRQEIKEIKKKFPFVKRLQLNDLEHDYYETLRYATTHFRVYFPLTDRSFHLVNDSKFVKTILNRKVIVHLDNSEGKGKIEKPERYMKKIFECLNSGINDISLAGGFGPGSLQTYFQIRDYFKINFSIDAETNLKAKEGLDVSKMTAYLNELLSSSKLVSGSTLHMKSNNSLERL